MNLNPHEALSPVRALTPQNVNSTQINGDTLAKPWRAGRTLLFTIIAAAMTTSDALTFRVQGRREGTSTWDNMDQGGTFGGTATDYGLVQTQAATAGTSAARLKDGKPVYIELDLNRLKVSKDQGAAFDYDALRLTAINAAAQNVLCAASALIADLYRTPNDEGVAANFTINQIRYADGNPDTIL